MVLFVTFFVCWSLLGCRDGLSLSRVRPLRQIRSRAHGEVSHKHIWRGVLRDLARETTGRQSNPRFFRPAVADLPIGNDRNLSGSKCFLDRSLASQRVLQHGARMRPPLPRSYEPEDFAVKPDKLRAAGDRKPISGRDAV